MAKRDGSQSPERAGDLVRALFGGAAQARLSSAQVAARAWYAANGDRERAHTTGVWLRKSGRAGLEPVMVVRLDSNLLAQELGTNKELYLVRLAHAGVRVSDIRFTAGQPSRAPNAPTKSASAQGKPVAPLPPLSADDRRKVRDATCHLPDKLQKSVARAMEATLRRSTTKS